MDEEKEEWRTIEGYEGLYEISNFGRVKSLPRYVNNHTGQLLVKEKIIKQQKNHKGYATVTLGNKKSGNKKTMFVHRLLAKAFIPNPNNLPQINHIDGDKLNNKINNLEWCDNSYNQIHAYQNGLNWHHEGSGRKKKPVYQIDITTKEIVNEFESATEAAKQIGSKQPDISACCRKERGHRVVKGYIWRYKEEYNEEEEKSDDYIYNKTVIQIKNSEIIAEYNSPIEASKVTGINSSSITMCCNHRKNYKTAGGYKWEYKYK